MLCWFVQYFLILGPFRWGGGVKPNFADKNFMDTQTFLTYGCGCRWAVPEREDLSQLWGNNTLPPCPNKFEIEGEQRENCLPFAKRNSTRKKGLASQTHENVRAAALQKCGSDFFLHFSLPKVSWNLAWNFGELFRATFSRVWVCKGKFHQNFTSKTVWKTENFTQISLCWGAALKNVEGQVSQKWLCRQVGWHSRTCPSPNTLSPTPCSDYLSPPSSHPYASPMDLIHSHSPHGSILARTRLLNLAWNSKQVAHIVTSPLQMLLQHDRFKSKPHLDPLVCVDFHGFCLQTRVGGRKLVQPASLNGLRRAPAMFQIGL